jgi:hypothetical protein
MMFLRIKNSTFKGKKLDEKVQKFFDQSVGCIEESLTFSHENSEERILVVVVVRYTKTAEL